MAAVITVVAAFLLPLLVWLSGIPARRSERREQLADLADQLILAVARFTSTVNAHHEVWVSAPSRAKIGMVALAELLEGWSRHEKTWAGLGGMARAVMGWDFSGNIALAKALVEPSAEIAAAVLLLDRCGDERLAAAGRGLADAAFAMRGAKGDAEALQAAMDGFAVQRWRVAYGRRWWQLKRAAPSTKERPVR